MNTNLTTLKLDALREIISIGSGHAATALSQLTKKTINIKVPEVFTLAINQCANIFGAEETQITAVYLQLLGDAEGVILFSFLKDDAIYLADILLGRKHGKTKILNEMAQSSLKEASLILGGAYLNAMSKLLKMRLTVSSPALAQDMAGAVVDNILIETAKEADFAIVVDTKLEIQDEKVKTFFFFIPNKLSLDKIYGTLGIVG